MMKRKVKLLAAVLCAVLLMGAAYAATTGGGSAQDPLVTLSYLDGVFAPQMERRLDAMVAQAVNGLELPRQEEQGQPASLFHVVTLTRGQQLVGDVGCEVMLRVGSAICVTDEATGLIDTTDGSVLQNGGELAQNHLYMVTISVRTVEAAADTTKLLVRGPYLIV